MTRMIVLTGGPGAGKTAVLEVVRRQFQDCVAVLPEAASIVFGGGFPRRSTDAGRRSAQRAIFHIQRELETLAIEENPGKVILCDRGTLDGIAYWPNGCGDLLDDVGTSLDAELKRYELVIRLQTPSAHQGYNHQNPLRVETAAEAALIDTRIGAIWASHPHLVTVPNQTRFTAKLDEVLELLRAVIPVNDVPTCTLLHGAGA